jgi:hypothetical protein
VGHQNTYGQVRLSPDSGHPEGRLAVKPMLASLPPTCQWSLDSEWASSLEHGTAWSCIHGRSALTANHCGDAVIAVSFPDRVPVFAFLASHSVPALCANDFWGLSLRSELAPAGHVSPGV